MHDPIFFIGYRATGKSTLGQCMAAYLGFEFMDNDLKVRVIGVWSVGAHVGLKCWGVDL